MIKAYRKESQKEEREKNGSVGPVNDTLCPSQSSLMVSMGRGSLSAFRSVITS